MGAGRMTTAINFVATIGDTITKEFDQDLEDISQAELKEAAEEYFNSLTEEELRDLYRDGMISIDDPLEEEHNGN